MKFDNITGMFDRKTGEKQRFAIFLSTRFLSDMNKIRT